MRLAPVCLLGLILLAPATVLACGGEAACPVTDGRYFAVPPPDWDGTSPMPVLVFFHGYASSGEAAIADSALLAAAHEYGALFVAPEAVANAQGKRSWAHQGSPSHNRNDLDYFARVMLDIAERFSVTDKRLIAGFSQGASMVWDIACNDGAAAGRYLAIAGAFWEPLPRECPGGPVSLRHIHGFADETVPLEGRPVGESAHQGDVFDSLDRLKATDGCAASPDAITIEPPLRCRAWTVCDSGETLALCLHDGGHSLEAEWLARALAGSWAPAAD